MLTFSLHFDALALLHLRHLLNDLFCVLLILSSHLLLLCLVALHGERALEGLDLACVLALVDDYLKYGLLGFELG